MYHLLLLRYFLATHIHCMPLMGVGKERRINKWIMVKPEKAAPVTGTQLRDPMDVGLTQWRVAVYVATVAEIGRSSASKNQIQPE